MNAAPPESRLIVNGWLRRRADLAREHDRIVNVQNDSRALVEELRRRRDGLTPRRLALPYLETAMRQLSDER